MNVWLKMNQSDFSKGFFRSHCKRGTFFPPPNYCLWVSMSCWWPSCCHSETVYEWSQYRGKQNPRGGKRSENLDDIVWVLRASGADETPTAMEQHFKYSVTSPNNKLPRKRFKKEVQKYWMLIIYSLFRCGSFSLCLPVQSCLGNWTTQRTTKQIAEQTFMHLKSYPKIYVKSKYTPVLHLQITYQELLVK